MGFAEQAQLGRDSEFKQRVQHAVVKSAIAVMNESYGGTGEPTAAEHEIRARFAHNALRNSERVAAEMAHGVVTNATITSESSDSDIEFTVNSMWDAFAGIGVVQ